MNPNEFGDKHTVDGVEMCIIEDKNEQLEREKSFSVKMDSYRDGLSKKRILIYVSEEEFGKLPRIGATLNYDDDVYQIIDATSEGGIFSISLEVSDE